MTQTYWPFDGFDTTEAQYSALFSRMQSTGVWGSPSDTNLKATADSSGMNIKLPAGHAFVRGHMYYNDALITMAIEPGDTNPRLDTLVLRLDPVANTITPAIAKGTPAATSPQPKAVVQTTSEIYELLLCTIAVPANTPTIALNNLTDRRTFAGQVWGMWATADRPANPRLGQPGFNYTLNRPEFHNGNSWVTFTPDLEWGSIANRPTQFPPSPHLHDIADIVHSSYNGGAAGSFWQGYLPATYAPLAHTHAHTSVLVNGSIITDWIQNNFAYKSHAHNSGDLQVEGYGLLTDWINNLYAAKTHYHDDRYYTEWESDGRYAAAGHQHNYGDIQVPGTGNIVDWVVRDYAAKGHTHAAGSITTTGSNVQADIDYMNSIKQDKSGVYYGAGVSTPGSIYAASHISSDGNIENGGTMRSGGSRNRQVTSNYVSLYADGNGQFGYAPSATRFKKNIETWLEADQVLDDFEAMRSVKYHLRQSDEVKGDPKHIGWLAEELVAVGLDELVPVDVDPDSDTFGQPITIEYAMAVVPLHMLAQRQGKLIRNLTARIESLEGAK